MVARIAQEGPHAELPVPVERRAAHYVPGVGHPVGLGLPAFGKAVDQIVVEADAAVPTRQDQHSRVQSAGLLERNGLPQFRQESI